MEIAMRKLKFLLLTIALAWPGSAVGGEHPKQATLYKNPQCGCCEGHARYLREHGFKVQVVPTHDLMLIKRQNGVSEPLVGCHTTMIDGYVIEGHVPARAIDRLLAERPAIKGISLPGMPAGSPGMIGRKTEPFTIYELTGGAPKIFAVE
jgi:hypothetical protein